MKIDVFSDVICPLSFLGKRRLDKALELVPDIKAEVTFQLFFLDASIPTEDFSRHKYGADVWAAALREIAAKTLA